MSDKTATVDTLVKLPPDAKKALRVYAIEKDSTMEVAGGNFIVEKLQQLGRVQKLKKPSK